MPENMNVSKFLSEFDDFWKYLSNEEKEYVVSSSSLMSYKAGQNVHSAGNRCAGVLFIKSGHLRVYIMSEEGKEITLYRLGENDVCILSASCSMEEITFDVYIDAEMDTEAVLLPTATFSMLTKKNIYIENYSNKMKAIRFSDVMWTMQQMLFFSFDKRLAMFLYDEYINHGPIITYSHMEIARYLGSAREVVSRMLKYFETEGIVQISRKEIKIIDKQKLMEKL